MKEIAFTVNPDSELYANHFIQKAEKKRFAELASAFLNAHFPAKATIASCLASVWKSNFLLKQKKSSAASFLKTRTAVAFPCSKQNPPKISAGTRRLFPKLTSKNTKPLVFGGWIFRGVGHLRTSLWDDGNGNVYGYYCSEFYSDKGTIPDYATEIKLSEYYAAVEAYEAEVKAK